MRLNSPQRVVSGPVDEMWSLPHPPASEPIGPGVSAVTGTQMWNCGQDILDRDTHMRVAANEMCTLVSPAQAPFAESRQPVPWYHHLRSGPFVHVCYAGHRGYCRSWTTQSTCGYLNGVLRCASGRSAEEKHHILRIDAWPADIVCGET